MNNAGHFLLRGLIVGVSIAAPVGPIGILCIRRTLAYGKFAGVVSGLGAATADAVYGCIAGFGLTVIARVLIEQKRWIGSGGGLFLLCLGAKIFFTKPEEGYNRDSSSRFIGMYASTLLLTLTNPMTIVSFTAIFAGLGVGIFGEGYRPAVMVVVGVFLGSMTWWMVLTSLVSLFRSSLSHRAYRWMNRAAGLIIGGFGIFALAGLLR
jgi:threonine/homoserine/homoserine lactone efflux protein